MTESSTTAQSLWLSAGLFVVVVLASQVVQNKRRQEEIKRKEEEDASLGHRYSMKRMTHAPEFSRADLSEIVERELKARNGEDLQDEGLDNDVKDFQPKNSNWNHFEMPEQELELNEEEAEDDDESSTSSEEEFLWTSSIRSRRRSSSISRSMTNGNKPSWARVARVLQRSFSSFATKCGDDLSTTKDEDALPKMEKHWQNVSQSRLPIRRQSSAPTPGSIACRRQSYEPQDQNRAARRKYNAQIMPNKVVMIRHGQSMGNINEQLYSTTPDNAMPLTELGWEQARKAGQVLKEQVLPVGETVHFIVSPYVRTVETFHGVVSAWCDPSDFKHIADRDKRLKAWYGRLLELGLTWHEDPRIREQDFGNYQDPVSIKKCKSERNRFGSFFYRFPHGESASDVFDRVSTFLDSLWRSFYLNRSRNYVLITHGISIRVLLARYFRYTIEQFQMLANPKNCEMVVLEHDGAGRLQLEGRYDQIVTEGDDGEKHVVGSTFHERLRVIPQEYFSKAKIRISYDD